MSLLFPPLKKLYSNFIFVWNYLEVGNKPFFQKETFTFLHRSFLLLKRNKHERNIPVKPRTCMSCIVLPTTMTASWYVRFLVLYHNQPEVVWNKLPYWYVREKNERGMWIKRSILFPFERGHWRTKDINGNKKNPGGIFCRCYVW